MIGNIINTVSTRISLAVLSIALLLLNSNFLGSEGLGTVGIIVLEITIYLLISNVVCGGSLIYFTSRKSANALLLAAYMWIVLSAAFYYSLILLIPVLDSEYATAILVLGFLQSTIGANLGLLAGQQRFKTFNFVALVQALVQIGTLCIFYFVLNDQSIDAFIQSTFIAYCLAFLLSFVRLLPTLEKRTVWPTVELFKELIQYGFYLQIANITQLLNYRLNYFLLDYFSGRASVGKFMAGVQLSEGLLLPSKSIGAVQYAKISSQKSNVKAARLSLTLLKVVFILTLPLVVILMLIPEIIYTNLLGSDFNETPLVISFMSAGIIALACEVILSRYFAGTGQQKVNATSSSIGLVVTVVTGFSLIPTLGLMGAAACASLSYLSIFLFLFYKIITTTNLQTSDFLLKKQDFIYLKRVIRKVRKD
ncbi:polysaccharide biosynthesis C-terminal domain-containing protein [Vicingaceae bacterium]|nr:polysaccharide biosynthesis C-terminal domain-containing protein [Vicingaceae bacterium]